MTSTKGLAVSASLVVDAPPEEIFELLANPREHPGLDGSGSVREIITGPDRLFLGAVFTMRMRIGAPYTMTNTVVEFEEARLIAWHTRSPHRWRYQLEPVHGGTRVTETWDATRVPAPMRWMFHVAGMPQRNLRGIRSTLLRLKETLEQPATEQ